MKILIDCYHISDKMRGMGVYLSEILEAVYQLPSIDFYLVTNSSVGAFRLNARFHGLENVKIKTLKGPLPIYEQILLPLYCYHIRADRLISSGNTATMFFISKKQILLIHDVYYLKKKKDSDGTNTIKRALGEIYRKLTISIAAKKSLGIISVSQFAKNDLVAELQVPLEKVAVIHNGVSPRFSLDFGLLASKKKTHTHGDGIISSKKCNSHD